MRRLKNVLNYLRNDNSAFGDRSHSDHVLNINRMWKSAPKEPKASTIVLVGDACRCGRQKLQWRLIRDYCEFEDDTRTWAVPFPYASIFTPDAADDGLLLEFRLSFLECAFPSPLRKLGYDIADMVVIMFGVNSPESLESAVEVWYEDILKYCKPGIPVMLLGTKCDLRSEPGTNLVSMEAVEAAAQKLGGIPYMECSAKTKAGFEEFPKLLARTLNMA
ncbi:P-loop containing nucleoside triphosphate hydrolase protein [Limtongia smithiae]|uniref:P-loop containing nucleoside triphosphate hydrolase protein n=1 Tax=Limtongia smithiae TaxID=1125753 RepID=UPI0034CD7B9E